MEIVKKVLIVLMLIIIILVAFGLTFSQQCSEIGNCKSCWSVAPREINSDLCPDPEEPCIAQPYQMQNNAIVDLILCGCEEAATAGYGDAELNSRIESIVQAYYGFEVDVISICNDPGLFMSKMRYE